MNIKVTLFDLELPYSMVIFHLLRNFNDSIHRKSHQNLPIINESAKIKGSSWLYGGRNFHNFLS